MKSVSPLGAGAALVRFETQRRDAGAQVQPPRAWVAVIRYRFSGEPMTREDRFVNPLGFQVRRYRRDAEALPDPEATAVPTTSGTASVPGMMPGTTPGGATTAPAPAPNLPAPQRAPARPGAPEVEL